ncbi:MAG: GntP family permease [Cyclonatronaceae bacterium]
MVFLWLLLVVLFVIALTVRLRVHAFLALLSGCLMMGLFTGMPASTLIDAIARGFGSTLQSIGIVIAAGTIIGEYLHRSGGAVVLAEKILSRIGDRNAPLAMSITGYIVSVPVFCDSGFIVLSALKNAIAQKSSTPAIVLSVALATGLYTTHVFVPPTPGPLAAAATLGAEVGLVLLLGLAVSVPVVIVGLLFALRLRRYNLPRIELSELAEDLPAERPSFFWAIIPIFLPILLIALRTVAGYPSQPFGSGWIADALIFAGHPIMALLIGAGVSFMLFLKGSDRKNRDTAWVESALEKAGVIILITGAGGAFGAVLRETEISTMAEQFSQLHTLGVFLPFLIAAFLKTAQGSSTVAIITTAALLVPLVPTLGFDHDTGKAILVLAIGAGAMTVSHVNDSYFWVVAKFSGMDTNLALKTHTLSTLLLGITGITTIYLLNLIL